MPDAAPRARLTVRFWGVRGSLPTPRESHLGVGGNTTCVEVRGPAGQVLILDMGTGARDLGVALTAEAGGAPLDLHVLFSHFHWDHLQGLPFFAPIYAAENRLRLRAVASDHEIRHAMDGQMQAPFFPVPFRELAATVDIAPLRHGEPFHLGAMRVEPFPLHHPQGSTGYRIEVDGAVFVFATDFEHGDAALEARLVEAARGADVLYSDAQYTPGEYALRQGWGHTTWEHAARLAAEADVGRLLLGHHDPAHDDAALERVLALARERFPRTDLAREGDAVRL
jgi:phosphoribosyl 1,2-cyclic phosphodiesterase